MRLGQASSTAAACLDTSCRDEQRDGFQSAKRHERGFSTVTSSHVHVRQKRLHSDCTSRCSGGSRCTCNPDRLTKFSSALHSRCHTASGHLSAALQRHTFAARRRQHTPTQLTLPRSECSQLPRTLPLATEHSWAHTQAKSATHTLPTSSNVIHGPGTHFARSQRTHSYAAASAGMTNSYARLQDAQQYCDAFCTSSETQPRHTLTRFARTHSALMHDAVTRLRCILPRGQATGRLQYWCLLGTHVLELLQARDTCITR